VGIHAAHEWTTVLGQRAAKLGIEVLVLEIGGRVLERPGEAAAQRARGDQSDEERRRPDSGEKR
jgi:hypothetical protein